MGVGGYKRAAHQRPIAVSPLERVGRRCQGLPAKRVVSDNGKKRGKIITIPGGDEGNTARVMTPERRSF